jgi:hypothetical protein
MSHVTISGKLCTGLGTAASSVHREIYKTVRTSMGDRVMSVREAGAFCLLCMAPYAQFVTGTELENVATMCFRAFDGANYETRKAIAKSLGTMLANTQQTPNSREGIMFQTAARRANAASSGNGAQNKPLALADALALLMQGFLKGKCGSICTVCDISHIVNLLEIRAVISVQKRFKLYCFHRRFRLRPHQRWFSR